MRLYDIDGTTVNRFILTTSISGAKSFPLKEFLAEHVAKWQVPESWAFIDEVPKTSVGKFDKKALRMHYETGDLAPRRV
jgi:acyl-CoA synthetase (AMP-forming)/AMP-acid ligase II